MQTYLALQQDGDPRQTLGAWLYECGLAEYARRRPGAVPGEIVVRLADLPGVTAALAGRLFGVRIVALPHGGPHAREVWLGDGREEGPAAEGRAAEGRRL